MKPPSHPLHGSLIENGLHRHEGEKLNVWVAWLKLELEHAEAPETAAMQLFQKALSYNDQKKLYLAFLDLLEHADQVSCLLDCKGATLLGCRCLWLV